jgi:gluconolactonase
MKALKFIQKHKIKVFVINIILLTFSCQKDEVKTPEALNEPECIIDNLQFAEGPAYYNGNLYFSDINANKIYTWNETNGKSVYLENSGASNGLYFDNSGNLIVCEGGNKRIVSIDINKNVEIITDSFEGKTYNEPNDLWISPKGDIYFTDPVYSGTLSQAGEYVYCVKASNGQVIRVVDDLVKPNGIVGNMDGTKLYIADWGASKIYQYLISGDGSLTNKMLFADIQADGLTIDDEGNIYAASSSIMKYDAQGNLLTTINISGTLTNLCFVNINPKQLFVTTHNKVYILKFNNN